MSRARALAVDDVATFRPALHTLLRTNRRLELVGHAESGERALPMLEDCAPTWS